MKRFLASFLLFLSLKAFGTIEMRCISAGTTGEVTLDWLNTSSSSLFRSYHVYHSVNASGPYTLIDSVTVYATQSFLHAGADVLNQDAYYYIVLNNTNGVTIQSDTIRAIRLSATGSQGYAELQWNASHVPFLSSNSMWHRIYREYPAGTVTLIDSINTAVASLAYDDEVFACGDTLKYHIVIMDSLGCSSTSTIAADFFMNEVPPETPHIDSVSIDATGNAVIGWSQSTSGDTYGYIVYSSDGQNDIEIDTVFGIGTTFYQTNINATSAPEGFRIIAIDSCGNPCGADPLQQTIFLEVQVDRCLSTAALTWSAYLNSSTSPVYNIIMNVNGGGDIIAGTTTTTNFTVSNLQADTSYCFRIVASVNTSPASSTSNRVCVTPDLPTLPQYSYIRSASVYPNDVVSIHAYVDPMAGIKEYALMRSGNESGYFTTIQTLPFSGLPDITFTDVVPTDSKWYYKIASIDSCGNDALSSQVSSPVVLDTSAGEDFQNVLSWINYSGWPFGSALVQLYRSTDGVYDPVPVVQFSPPDSSFIDDVRDYFNGQGNFCYYLVAFEAPGNPYGFSDSLRSNEVCVRQKTRIYIPNAFRPGGVNGVFNPAESFSGIEGYSFYVFNRFGEIIFETDNPSVGWDGTNKSHHAQEGVYVYKISLRNEKGEKVEKMGRVTLIR